MKKLVWLVAGGLALVVASLAMFPALRSGQEFRLIKAVVGLLAAASATRAAIGFEPGEHLRRAWSLLALDYALLALAQVTELAQVPVVVAVGLTLLINAFGIAAVSTFARASALAGLPLRGTRGVYLVTAVLALVLVGVPFVHTLRHLQAGNLRVLIITVSSLGDLVTFTLIGPLLLTALALRGGLLLWPWAFLVASNIAWFLQDAAAVAQVMAPALAEDSVSLWSNLWQVLACFLAFAAASAQRRVSLTGDVGELIRDERP